MIDLTYSWGMAFWAIPADKLLDSEDTDSRAFTAEFDLIAGNRLFLPDDDRGAAARTERFGKIRAAAEANPGKLLLVGNDLAFEEAVPLDHIDGRGEIQPLSLYTWRYVIDLGRTIPATITDDRKLLAEGVEVDPDVFCRGKILRGVRGILIPADDPVSAQVFAALVAAGRHGDAAMAIPLEHLGLLCLPAQKFWASPAPAIIDALWYQQFAAEGDEKGGHDDQTLLEIAAVIAASRNGIEADLTPTHGVRDAWRLIGLPPLWQQITGEVDLVVLRKSIGHITDEDTGAATSPIYGGELFPPDHPSMGEIYLRLEAAHGVPREVTTEDDEAISHFRLYAATTHYFLLHMREENPIEMFTWDRLRN